MIKHIINKSFDSISEHLKICLVIALCVPILEFLFMKSGLIYIFTYEWSDTYTIGNYLSIFFYDILWTYLGTIVAVYFHNSVILNQRKFNFFSKSIIKYFVFILIFFSLSTPLEYFMSFGPTLPSLVVLAMFISFCFFLFLCLFFLWSLYLPNIATKHEYNFWYVIKKSKGFRLTMVYQVIFLIILFLPCMITLLLPVMGTYLFMFFGALIGCYGIFMLSHTYLLWEESLKSQWREKFYIHLFWF